MQNINSKNCTTTLKACFFNIRIEDRHRITSNNLYLVGMTFDFLPSCHFKFKHANKKYQMIEIIINIMF